MNPESRNGPAAAEGGSLQGRRIVLGVSGGIAAYKAVELARLLALEGAEVQAVLTAHALEFIRPLPFQILTGNAPVTQMFPIQGAAHPGDMPHISLTARADLVAVSPATANLIGKLAHGMGDDFLSTLLLSARAPVLIAPAMNPRMWENPAVQENVKRLRGYGHVVMPPETGRLARREEGEGTGRMPEPSAILAEIHRLLTGRSAPAAPVAAPAPAALAAPAAAGDLSGMKILISAGPTREPWDAVRFLSNRSSGKMGYALAAAAAARGAEVTLVSGPVELPDPPGVKTIRVETAGEMSKTVLETWKNVNAAVMAAAVADYRPARPHAGKFKKGKRVPSISLARTQDILAEMGNEKIGRILVGFAAESERVKENAKAKLKAKRLDLIVANPIAGKDDAMGADMSRAYLIDASGGEEELPRLPKAEVAERVLDRIAALWRKSKAPKSAGRYIGRRRPQKRASQKKRHVPKPPAR